MTKLTPENIRSEVIQTTCSASKKLTLAFANFFKSEAFKIWAELVYSERNEKE